MASNITLHAMGVETTTTLTEQKGNVIIQPREVDGYGAGAPVDLGDARSISLLLDVQPMTPSEVLSNRPSYANDFWPGLADTILEATVETAEDATAWRPLLTFTRVKTGLQQQRLSAVADRYVRVVWRCAQLGSLKGGIKWALTGRAVGA